MYSGMLMGLVVIEEAVEVEWLDCIDADAEEPPADFFLRSPFAVFGVDPFAGCSPMGGSSRGVFGSVAIPPL